MFLLNRFKALVFMGGLFCGAVIAPLLSFSTASAQSSNTATWVNQATINYQGTNYKENDATDTNWHFYANNPDNDCPQEIDGFNKVYTMEQTVKLHKQKKVAGGCSSDGISDITLKASPQSYKIIFVWKDSNNIETADGKRQFSLESEGNFLSVSDTSNCRDYIRVGSDNKHLTLVIRTNDGYGSESATNSLKRKYGESYYFHDDITTQVDTVDVNGTPCHQSDPITNIAADDTNAADPGTSVTQGSSVGQNQPSCESEGASLSWIICPVLYMGDAILRKLDQAVIGLLSIPNDYYTNPDLKNAWSRVRNIAYILLVPVMLVMVISTALGFDFISAYTVKKALPRLVAAVIFIAVSFELTKFMIIITNDVGKSIHGLIIGAFTGADSIGLDTVFSPNNSDSIVGIPFAGLAVTGALAVGSIGIVLSYILIGIVALAIGFFLLSFRQMLLIALMLVAPLAILAWIFPGNDKLWKLWWGTFSKLLLLFPLIMLLIAVGKSFALLVASEDGSLVSTLLKLVAYVGPYFLIPATFKFAGGTFASIAGMANNRSRGLFDRNKKYRQAQMAQNWEHRGARRVLQGRAEAVRRLQARGSRGGFGAFASRGLAKTISGYNLEGAMSAKQAAVGKEVNDVIATGRDDAVRGLAAVHSLKRARDENWDGKTDTSYARVRDNKRQYKSIGGAWVDEAYVREGQSRWGNDRFAQQAALSYEMRKAMTSDQVAGISQDYSTLANSWGMTGTEAGGAWIGAAFENQGQHIEYKNTDFNYEAGKIKGPGQLNAAKFANEIYEKKGSYPLAQMSAHTIEQLKNAYDSGDPGVQQQVREIAETFTFRSGGIQADESGTIIPTGGGTREVSAPGAASVNQAVRELYSHVNPGREAPGNPDNTQE